MNINNIAFRRATKADLPKLGEFLQMLVKAERPYNPTLKHGEIFYHDNAAAVSAYEKAGFEKLLTTMRCAIK